jgi:hypothetical protein
MQAEHLDVSLPAELDQTLEMLAEFTPEQLKIVAEFVTQAGGFEQARAAIEAVESVSDAA